MKDFIKSQSTERKPDSIVLLIGHCNLNLALLETEGVDEETDKFKTVDGLSIKTGSIYFTDI